MSQGKIHMIFVIEWLKTEFQIQSLIRSILYLREKICESWTTVLFGGMYLQPIFTCSREETHSLPFGFFESKESKQYSSYSFDLASIFSINHRGIFLEWNTCWLSPYFHWWIGRKVNTSEEVIFVIDSLVKGSRASDGLGLAGSHPA